MTRLVVITPTLRRLQALEIAIRSVMAQRGPNGQPDEMVIADNDPDGSARETVVYEVKFRDDLRDNWVDYRPRFVAATRYCRERGWRFKIMTERRIRTPMLSAVKFLRPYRRIEDHAVFRERLVAGLRDMGPTTVAQLLEATFDSKQERLQALPSLWKLVANFHVEVDFGKPLSMRTQVRSAT